MKQGANRAKKHAAFFLLGIFFNHEDGGDMLL
jgi:hypothetical protein